jgi:hypothetical protein
MVKLISILSKNKVNKSGLPVSTGPSASLTSCLAGRKLAGTPRGGWHIIAQPAG